jgi:hypothetical protein
MNDFARDSAYVTAHDAALELSTTQLRVLMLIKRGSLQGEVRDGEWYVERSSIDMLKLRGIEPPEPPACKSSCSATSCSCSGKGTD